MHRDIVPIHSYDAELVDKVPTNATVPSDLGDLRTFQHKPTDLSGFSIQRDFSDDNSLYLHGFYCTIQVLIELTVEDDASGFQKEIVC
jgi:hypothetical protein